MRASFPDLRRPESPRVRLAARGVFAAWPEKRVCPDVRADAATPALVLWRALRDCPDLDCRFSTRVGFLVARGPLMPAHVCRPGEAAVLAVHASAWTAVDVAPHLGREALRVSGVDAFTFLRVSPGPRLSSSRWSACLRLAEALPVVDERSEEPDPFASPGVACDVVAGMLPRFWRNLANVGQGALVTLNTGGLRVRFPLLAAHVACDGARLLVAARDDVVLQLELGSVAEVRRGPDDTLSLFDAEGREAVTVGAPPDGPDACAKTWAAVLRHYFPDR